MGNKAKKLVVLTTSLMFLLTAFAACKVPDDNSGSGSSGGGDSSGGGQSSRPTFALENNRVELETEEDLELITAFNDYAMGGGEPTISLDTTVKKFGEASLKVENPADAKFTSDNSWPSVEVAFKKPQDFSTKKYTQFHVYSEESEPFVMNVQFSVDGTSGYKSNMRQINPGWNVIEITNNVSRDFSIPVDFSKVTSFIFSVWGHAKETCTYYIDDIVLTDTTAQTGDIYEIVSFDKTSYVETKGGNFMVPYTMFTDSVPSMATAMEVTDDGKVLFTQYNDWHFIGVNAFNTAISNYSVLEVDFENVSDSEVEVGIAAEGGDYRDGGPRIAPSATMVRQKLQPGEKATLTLEISSILSALQGKSETLTLDNLAYFHIFSVGDYGVNRTFAVSSMRLLTENGKVQNSAEKVAGQIAKLPATEELKMKHIEVVADIRVQYDALSDGAKALVENYDVLVAAEAKIAAFGDANYADGVEELIASLPTVDVITLADIETVASVRAIYNALTDGAKALVENIATLEAVETKIDELVGEEVEAAIAALPAVDVITLAERAVVLAAREAYDALTESQKAYVDNLETLVVLENKLQELLGGEAVVELIAKIKQEGVYTGEDVAAILAARNAYNALTTEQKEDVTNLALLEEAEEKMLAVKTFSSENSAANLEAALWGTDSGVNYKTGYVAEIGGKTGGFGWVSSQYSENTTYVGDDANSDGYFNDGGWAYIRIVPEHEKSAYQALLNAGYTTITFQIYQVADSGSFGYWSGMDNTRWNQVSSGEWHTFELSLEVLVNRYDQIMEYGKVSLLAFDNNNSTTLTIVYISDITIKGLDIVDPTPDPEPVPDPEPDPEPETEAEKVVALIAALKQEGAYTGDDIAAIFAAREAYDALGDAEKEEVTNVALLESAEARMLSVKTFSSEADASNLTAGIYNTESLAKYSTGYVAEIGGLTGGFGWVSTKFADGAVTSDDANGDGYINEGGWSYIKIVPEHEKSAYQALLNAGYTTIVVKVYQVADNGSFGYWSGMDSGRWGFIESNKWIELEFTLAALVEKYDAIVAGGTTSILGIDHNVNTTLTTVYISDVMIKALPVQEPVEENPQAVVEAISALKQEGAFSGEDVNAILAARTAYNALSDEGKEAVTNVALLESAEARMFSVKTFSSESDASNLTAGIYSTESLAKYSSGYVAEIGGKTGGFGWISTKYADGANTSDDTNKDGYLNDGGWSYIKIVPEHTKSAYQALLDAGYTTVSFQIYQVADDGGFGYWSDCSSTRWGVLSSGEWHTLELSLATIVEKYDAIVAGGNVSLLGIDANVYTTLTTVYISDLVVTK